MDLTIFQQENEAAKTAKGIAGILACLPWLHLLNWNLHWCIAAANSWDLVLSGCQRHRKTNKTRNRALQFGQTMLRIYLLWRGSYVFCRVWFSEIEGWKTVDFWRIRNVRHSIKWKNQERATIVANAGCKL